MEREIDGDVGPAEPACGACGTNPTFVCKWIKHKVYLKTFLFY